MQVWDSLIRKKERTLTERKTDSTPAQGVSRGDTENHAQFCHNELQTQEEVKRTAVDEIIATQSQEAVQNLDSLNECAASILKSIGDGLCLPSAKDHVNDACARLDNTCQRAISILLCPEKRGLSSPLKPSGPFCSKTKPFAPSPLRPTLAAFWSSPTIFAGGQKRSRQTQVRCLFQSRELKSAQEADTLWRGKTPDCSMLHRFPHLRPDSGSSPSAQSSSPRQQYGSEIKSISAL